MGHEHWDFIASCSSITEGQTYTIESIEGRDTHPKKYNAEIFYSTAEIFYHQNIYIQDTLNMEKNRYQILVNAYQHVSCGNQDG